ncbi:MAG TPA: DUF5818 domain-containing protein [Verrucomicrobiae bacterium]|nr:DUF5818 domain-containing protein [Verrucomicrobiae bacterium]
MPKTLMFVFVLLLSTAWLQAQTQNSPMNSSQKGSTASSQTAAGNRSVEGCLQSSNGNYTLTATTGTMYRLEGDTSQLSEHVGHKVEITGTMTSATSSNTGSAMSPSGSQEKTITVESVKHISKTCKETSKYK